MSRARWRRTGEWLRPETLQGKAGLSLAAHLAALFLLLNGWWFGARRLQLAGTRQGLRPMVAYVPGKKVSAQLAKRTAAVVKHKPPKSFVLKTAAAATMEAAPEIPNDALGNDEVSIARVEGFPHQRPDLSRAGATGDVIVDVEIDDTGHVTQVHTREGMGAAVDDVVAATVVQWVVHPALRAGKPIGCKREIHFHFDRRRNPAGCGWDCFALAAQ